MGKKKKHSDHQADRRGKPFIGLPAAVLYSDAYRDLTLPARTVLVEILGRFNGYNNGVIALSQRELAYRLNTSNFRMISKATAELVLHGFVDVATEGQWKQRQAREYRLTFISSGKAPPYRPATNDYAKLPPKAFSRADTCSAAKRRTADTCSAALRKLADTGSAAIAANPWVRGSKPADTGSTLLGMPYRETERGGSNLIPFPASHHCEKCGGTFQAGSRGKLKRFCSERCRKRAEYKRARDRKISA